MGFFRKMSISTIEVPKAYYRIDNIRIDFRVKIAEIAIAVYMDKAQRDENVDNFYTRETFAFGPHFSEFPNSTKYEITFDDVFNEDLMQQKDASVLNLVYEFLTKAHFKDAVDDLKPEQKKSNILPAKKLSKKEKVRYGKYAKGGVR